MKLDGNSRVGLAKVCATQKEMDQENEITRLRELLIQAKPYVESAAIRDHTILKHTFWDCDRWLKAVEKELGN